MSATTDYLVQLQGNPSVKCKCGVKDPAHLIYSGDEWICYGCYLEREADAVCTDCGRPLSYPEECDCVKLARMKEAS